MVARFELDEDARRKEPLKLGTGHRSRQSHLARGQVGEAGRVPWSLVVMTPIVYCPKAVLSVPWGWAGTQRAAAAAPVIYWDVRMSDESARRRIARGWATTTLDQKSYAAKNGVSARTLREWVRLYGTGDRPAARARAIIDDAIAQFQALRATLDAEEACPVGAKDAGQEAGEVQPERHAEPAVKLRVLPPPADPEPAPRPLRRGGFFASMEET